MSPSLFDELGSSVWNYYVWLSNPAQQRYVLDGHCGYASRVSIHIHKPRQGESQLLPACIVYVLYY
eukprot:COSAG02_NODE_23278_length_723_cov_2.701923_1_plen_65_part_10